MRRPTTVRARVTILATVAVLVVVVLAGFVLLAEQRRLLTESLDDALESRAEELEAIADDLETPITGQGDDDAVAQLVADDGQVLAGTINSIGMPPLAPAPAPDDDTARTVDDLAHEDGRFRVVSVGLDDGTGRSVHVAGPMEDIDESIATLRRSLLLVVPMAGAALAAVLWWFVGRTLRPVEAIRAEVAAIGGADLHRRVPVGSGDDEITRLARTMNGMLDRVEDAAQRQQRFVADASHELRSPLTRVRSELEVDLAHPDQADPWATHASVLEETIALQRLAEDLLLVARGDAGAGAPVRRQRVDLDDLVVRVARRLRADDRVRVDLGEVSAAQVSGDPDQLARLVGNLADNAVRHAAGVVAFAVAEVDAQAVVSVTDDGPGIPAEDRERVFERFARVDGARTAGQGGAGLGLAIARDIAVQHGGTLGVEARPDGRPGARFVVRLPRTD